MPYGAAALGADVLENGPAAFVLQAAPAALKRVAQRQRADAPVGAWTLGGTLYGGGNPLPGASITLFDAATASQLASTVTDYTGQYSFPVDDGNYNLLVSLLLIVASPIRWSMGLW